MIKKTTTSVGFCVVVVEGLDMDCPRCGTKVRSGQRHVCGDVKSQPPPKRKASRGR